MSAFFVVPELKSALASFASFLSKELDDFCSKISFATLLPKILWIHIAFFSFLIVKAVIIEDVAEIIESRA